MKIGKRQPIGNEFKDRIIMRALAMCKSYLRWKSSGTSTMNAFAQQKKQLSDTMDTYIDILIRGAKKQVFDDIEKIELNLPIKDKMSIASRFFEQMEDIKKKHLGDTK